MNDIKDLVRYYDGKRMPSKVLDTINSNFNVKEIHLIQRDEELTEVYVHFTDDTFLSIDVFLIGDGYEG